MRITLLIILTLLTSLSAQASGRVYTVTEANPIASLRVETRLSAGYQLHLGHYDPRLVSLVDSKASTTTFYHPRMGRDGKVTWRFSATPYFLKHPQSTTVTFYQVRPWEPDKAITLKFTITSKKLTNNRYTG